MKAAIYTRLSYARGEDVSIARQVAICSEVAKSHGWKPVVFQEHEGHRSGRSEAARPAWRELKEAIATDSDFVALIVADISRASRSVVDFFRLMADLAKRKQQLISLKENFDTTSASGRAMLGMVAVFNAWFSEDLSDRQRIYATAIRKSGGYVGRVPFACKLLSKGAGRKLGLSDETYTYKGKTRRYADTLLAWLRLYAGERPIGITRGAETLNDAGYRTRGNKPVKVKTVFNILRSVERGTYDGVIDDALLNRVRARMKERTQRKENGRDPQRPPLLLWRIVFCPDCGNRFTVREDARGKKAYTHWTGACSNNSTVGYRHLDDEAKDLLRRLVTFTPEQKRSIAAVVAKATQTSDDNRYEILTEKLHKLDAWAVSAMPDNPGLRAQYEREHARLTLELDSLSPQKKIAPVSEEQALAALDNFASMVERTETANGWLANHAVRSVFAKLYVKNSHIVDYDVLDEVRPYVNRGVKPRKVLIRG